MHRNNFMRSNLVRRSSPAFTLIELLVVIAILAVLAVVVVLTLNPAGLLQESRDANRLQDMATLNSAISYSLADNVAESLGAANTVYVSIADPTATSTLGDQCQGLGLPSLPVIYSYHCAASSTWRKTDGTGWIPVNLTNNSFGSSLSQLPADPVNSTSSRLYYSYATDANGKFEVTSGMESSKYQVGGSSDVISGDGGTLASVYEKGSKLGLEPLDYGDSSLVGYWTFDEGNGSTTYDYSGNNATGSWNGTATGTSGYYSPGKVGSWGGAFDGTSTRVVTPVKINSDPITLVGWVNLSNVMGPAFIFGNDNAGWDRGVEVGGSTWDVRNNTGNLSTGVSASTNQWYQVAIEYFSNSSVVFYLNGIQVYSTPESGVSCACVATIGGTQLATRYFTGLIDDVRIYNRALTAAQVAAMYAGGK